MAIEVPTKQQLLEKYERVLRSLDSTLAVHSDSDVGLRGRLLVEMLYGLHYEHSKTADDQFLTAKATTEAIERHAEARFGSSPRKGATKSTGADALTVTGTVGSTLSVGQELVANDGTRFQNTSGGTIPSGGSLTVDVESIDTGTVANRESGETLTFVSPETGIDSAATVAADIEGGEDQETDGELIARVLDAYRNPPAAGRFSDYRQWAVAVEGVAKAYVYGPSSDDTDGRRGLGIVDVAILKSGSGSNRIPTATLQDSVTDYIDDRRPCTTQDFSVLIPDTDSQSVDIQLTPKTGYGWDWTKDTAAVAVSSWTSGTKTLTLDDTVANLSSDIAVGDRMLIDGQLAKVDSLPGGSDIVLQPLDNDENEIDDFVRAPTSSDGVWPAGPLTSPALVALQDYFDSLGPARGTAADPDQDWEDTLRVAGLYDLMMDIAGVKDAVVVTPAANVTPTDAGAGGTVDVIIANVLTVRPA